MVLEFLRNVIAPIATALLTVWLVHKYESNRTRTEHSEKLVGQLFDKYVNALTETYEIMSVCFNVLNRYANSPPSTRREFNTEVSAVKEKWEGVEQKNALWLKPIENEISAVRGEFRMANMAIFQAIGQTGTSFNRWQQFSDAFFAARDAIRNLIPISHLENRLQQIGQ